MNAQQSSSQSVWLSRKVGEVVTEDFRRAHIFSQFDIDFCCGGGRPLQQAYGFNQLPLEQLIDHIEQTHHQYARDKAPLLFEYSEKNGSSPRQ